MAERKREREREEEIDRGEHDRKEENPKSKNTPRNSREILSLVKLTKSTPVCDFGRLLKTR